jgi:voltage-gated potassium channel
MSREAHVTAPAEERPSTRRRARLHEIVFESDTRAGRIFDLTLIWLILLSVATVVLESVAPVRQQYGQLLYGLEWLFTVLFTVEYFLRLASVRHPWRYATSFFGVVDLLAIIPTYLSIFVPGSQYLLVIRILRLLRVFRLLKLSEYVVEADTLRLAIRAQFRQASCRWNSHKPCEKRRSRVRLVLHAQLRDMIRTRATASTAGRGCKTYCA